MREGRYAGPEPKPVYYFKEKVEEDHPNRSEYKRQ